MITTMSVRAELERRSARAELLANESSSAREPLRFAAALCRAQASLADSLSSAAATPPLSDLVKLSEPLLRIVADRGPEVLVEQALQRLDDDPAVAENRLQLYWRGETTTRDDYLSRAILRPYAEVMRAKNVTPDRVHTRGHCPFCGGPPIVGTLRSMPDAEAGLRMLHCALCGLDWNVNRVRCPSCSEENPDKLPVYGSDAHPNVRIEACDTCRRYVKSIDLTKDARPIAEIDDLVSLSLDLWAMDEGLTRIEPGLAGV